MDELISKTQVLSKLITLRNKYMYDSKAYLCITEAIKGVEDITSSEEDDLK